MSKPIVKYEQYNPMLVKDEYGNDYICLNMYEAGRIKALLRALKATKMPVDTGDWFTDIALKIPPEWSSNDELKEFIRRLSQRLPQTASQAEGSQNASGDPSKTNDGGRNGD